MLVGTGLCSHATSVMSAIWCYIHQQPLACSQAVDEDGQIIKCLSSQGCNAVARLPASIAGEYHGLAQCMLESSFISGVPFVSRTTTMEDIDKRKPATTAPAPGFFPTA